MIFSTALQQAAGLGLAVLAVGFAAFAYGRVAFRVGMVCAVSVVFVPHLMVFGIVYGGIDGPTHTAALTFAERLFWIVPSTMGFALALACLRFYPRDLTRSLFVALLMLSLGMPLLGKEVLLVYWGLLIAFVIVFALRPSRRGDVPQAARPWMLASAASFALSFLIYVVPDVVIALGQSSFSVRMESIVKALQLPYFSYEMSSAKALVVAALLSLNAGLPMRRILLVFATLAIGSELIVIATEMRLRLYMDPYFAIWMLINLGAAVQFFALIVAILLHWLRPSRVWRG
ncbi:hypothetical protein PUT78_12295 [Roseinatronobacter sp. HJB301]|uniref:Uncharacterized protein n=2 Tax=Roseinatronobacter alkalisoli TaxID=3028235 RepID=A0ABT5TA93_9RHOB|nr:hypothetical protein [Roseinatronobacter sp. HJB301]